MFVRHIRNLPRLSQFTVGATNCTTAAATKSKEQLQQNVPPPSDYRTNETDTAAHSSMHVGKYYTISPDDRKLLFAGGGLPKQFQEQTKTFAETCLMVRPQALELIDYIRRTDFSKPIARYVLYGDNGVGKSLTMAHVLHYGFQNDFLLVHVPWAPNWMKRPKDKTNVGTDEIFFDLPFDAAAWLVHFKTQNAKLFAKLDLKISQDYVWSKREMTPAGSTLIELMEHGIARIKFASETISAIMTELKLHATAGQCKVLVAIDGFNAFFHPVTRIFGEHKQRMTPDKITLTKPFLDICKYDWTNGVCIVAVDKIAATEGYMDSYMPRYLLGKAGFEHLDPFVPVHVDNYSEKEFTSCINYYLDRNWIQKRPEGFEEQLKYMSNKNPYSLMQLTRSL